MSPAETKLSPAAGYKTVYILRRPNRLHVLFESLYTGIHKNILLVQVVLFFIGDILPEDGDILPKGRMRTVTKMSPGRLTKMFLLQGFLPSSPAEKRKIMSENWVGLYYNKYM
jgi:hypothetical protein